MTSGSSGKPKSVVYSHSATWHSSYFAGKRCDMNQESRVIANTSPAWAVFLWQFFSPLAHGSCCVMVPNGAEADPQHISKLIVQWRASVLFGVARMLELILAALEAFPL